MKFQAILENKCHLPALARVIWREVDNYVTR